MKVHTTRKLLFIFLAALVAAVFGAGCASVPLAPKEKDVVSKSFTPTPGKSQIYVYRNESMGGALPMTVAVDDRILGRTAPKTYLWWEGEPGEHTVASHTENVSELNIKTEPGKLYFIWQEVKMGVWAARSLLQQVDEATGKTAVMECELSR
ncbi:MAG: hypothetical protein HW377_2240 [Actinobacteria bacterium]|nr:hypothetical protein [Actinomycetota bacterium]MBM2828280.1 hypothetical protein [Actinomycetota bacterium]